MKRPSKLEKQMAERMHRNGQDDLMERTRAARTLVNSKGGSKELDLEAFMGLFHPELQKDRAYMFALKEGLREREKMSS